MDASYIH